MPKEQEIETITLSGRRVGIVGLGSILQWVASLGLADEKQITARLIEGVKSCNYVPDSTEAKYGQALLRAYQNHLGQKVDGLEQEGGLVIRILGPGCPRCDRLTRDVRNALAELGLVADVEHVRDPQRMVKYGFISTPALVINSRVRSSGRLPSREKIKIWLQE